MLWNVALCMGSIQLLTHSAQITGWNGDTGLHAWSRRGLLELHILAAPIQHFQNAILDPWGAKVAKDDCQREGFREGPLLDSCASQQLLFGNEIKDYSEAFFLRYGMDFLGQFLGQIAPYRFCGGLDGDGHVLLDCPYPPFASLRESLNSPVLFLVTRLIGQDAFFMAWLASFISGNVTDSPCATNPTDDMFKHLETCLGLYRRDMIDKWVMDDESDAEETVEYMSIVPNTWSDVSEIQDPISKFEVAAWSSRAWGHVVFIIGGDAHDEDSSRVSSSITTPLQTAQRAELSVFSFLFKPLFMCLLAWTI